MLGAFFWRKGARHSTPYSGPTAGFFNPRCALSNRTPLLQEISTQMGKPLGQALGEVNGLVDRTR